MADQPAKDAPKPRRSRKRIVMVSGAVVLGLLLLILAAGPSVTAAVAKSSIESTLAEKLDAEVRIQELSAGWSGSLSLSGLRIVPSGFSEPLLEIPEVNADVALLSALSGSYVARVEVKEPRLLIEKGADGRFNYEPPVRTGEEERPEAARRDEAASDESPFVQATVIIRGGRIAARTADAETVYENLELEARIDTLDKPVAVALAVDDPRGGRFEVKGEYDLTERRGSAGFVLENLSLGNLSAIASLYGFAESLDGSVNGKADYTIALPAAFHGTGELSVEGVATLPGGAEVRLEQIRLTHSGELDDAGAGNHHGSITWGKALAVTFKAGVRDAFGEAAVKLALEGRSDLAELSRSLEKGAGLKPGVSLAGSVDLTGEIETKGVETVGFDLAADARNLQAVDADGKRYEIDPFVRLEAAGGWDGAKRAVDLRSFRLASSFATADARGGFTLADPPVVRESSLDARLDLNALGARLKAFLVDPPGLGGTATVKASMTGDRFAFEAKTTELTYTAGAVEKGAAVGPVTMKIVQKGVLEKDGTVRIEEGTIESDAVNATLAGSISLAVDRKRAGRLDLEVVIAPEDLARWFEGLRLGGKPVAIGCLLHFGSDSASLSGKASIDRLLVGEGADRQEVGALVEFSLQGKEGAFTARVSPESSVVWRRGGYVVQASGMSSLVYREGRSEGKTTLHSLSVVDPGKRSMREGKAVTLVHEVELSGETLTLKKLELNSGFVRGGLTGKVVHGAELAFDGLRGSFTYHPSRLGAVLAPWLPGTLTGEKERSVEVSLDGKASDVDVFSVLRGGRGVVDLDLAPFATTGLSVSGRSRLDLKGGRLAGRTPLEVNGGTTDLDLSLDFRVPADRPRSVLRFTSEGVRANGSMGPLLSKISPLLYVSGLDAALDGVVRSQFDLAWEGPIEGDSETLWNAAPERLSGKGSLAIESLSVRGSPLVGLLLDVLAGTGNGMDGDLRAEEIVVGGGKCRYRNMTLRLKKYQVLFSGWVAFDGRMELMLETPITERLGKRYPVLRQFFGKTLFLPVRGTVRKPRVDLGAAVQEFLKRNAPATLVEELLRRGLGGKDEKPPPKDPVRGLLDRIFRGKKKKDDK